jgi:uncharacterized protein with LGFP repeats
MGSPLRTCIIGLVCGLWAWPLASPAVGEPAPAPSAQKACGFSLSEPALTEWNALGGRDGRLGCPTSDEAPSVPSPAGTGAAIAVFVNGAILTPSSGPNAGLAFAVTGCAWRLFFQFGASGGWLGLPVEESQNTPDGQTQRFEGGTVTYTRAYDACDAEPAAPSAGASRNR